MTFCHLPAVSSSRATIKSPTRLMPLDPMLGAKRKKKKSRSNSYSPFDEVQERNLSPERQPRREHVSGGQRDAAGAARAPSGDRFNHQPGSRVAVLAGGGRNDSDGRRVAFLYLKLTFVKYSFE